ncbi:MAG: VWA domain-containing protein [Crocinitomicaceae bacterium]
MKRFLLIAFLLLGATQLSWSQKNLTRILFIFDASNSMNGKWQESTRLEVAKKLLASTVDSLKGIPNLEIGLRIYGHQSPVTATFQDCNDTKLEVPFGPNNHDLAKATIKNIKAKGTTPIALSLEAAAGDFPNKESRNVIVLITDGVEACGKDPCRIAMALRAKGINVKPFVVGLGIDLQYIHHFDCIGEFHDVQNEQSFKNVLNLVVEEALNNTSVEIDLLNTLKQPKETDVTVFCYKAGTQELKYTFFHTLNRYGNPDTLTMDPVQKYDVFVNTIPPVQKKNVSLTPGIHNHIKIDAPQGFIQLHVIGERPNQRIQAIVRQKDLMNTLNVQEFFTTEKYITGTYDLEILTLPRIYMNDVKVEQSTTNYIEIKSPGKFEYECVKPVSGQIFVLRNGKQEWVCNIHKSMNGYFDLQPGNYKIVYRQTHFQETIYTTEKTFTIFSGGTKSLKL